MNDETKERIERELARAREASSIIDAPIYRESMDKMKQEIIDKWAACSARDTEGREWLWQHYQVALKFEESLQTVMNTGKMALKEREMSLTEKIGQTIRRFA